MTLNVVQKKVCMVGAFAVGKTSLIARFVQSMFSDKYLTTVGVKIEKKTVRVADRDATRAVGDALPRAIVFRSRFAHVIARAR